jgi:hypothetical protein
MIHATNKDSVWLENDPQIDMYKVKKTLDEMGWSGWLLLNEAAMPKNLQIPNIITERIQLI